MNLNYFSILGYISVALWMLVPVLMAVHLKQRPRRWLCHCAFVIALLAYLLAKINSVNHVERIQPDQSAAIAAAAAEQQAAVKAAEAARSDAAAKVGFAEDSHDEKLDKGGMDDADLKYMEKIAGDSAAPAWKQRKKLRSGDKADGSLDALVGADEGAGKGMAKAAEAEQEKEPLVMPQRDVDRANRLDRANLLIIRLLVLAAFLLVVFDYLSRFNVYSEAYLPLPLPSLWVNALSPLPPLQTRTEPPRRSLKEELEWVIRRGDSFVYFAPNAAVAAALPSSLPRFGRKCCPAEVICVQGDAPGITDAFVFESLWYGRASFVVDSPTRAVQMLGCFKTLLSERKPFNAKVAHSVHIFWGCGMPLTEEWKAEFAKLSGATGMTLVLCRA